MTGNPAAPRTGGGRNRPASYDRGIDPAPYGIPRPASAGRRGRIRLPFRTSLTAGNPMFPDLRESRGPGPEARAARPTERHAGVPPSNGFSFLPVG